MQLGHVTHRSPRQAFGERQQRIYDFLQPRCVGVLSSVTPDGDPHGAVVYYVLDADFTIWLLTKTGTHKYDNLKHNNHVILNVFDVTSQSVATVVALADEHPDSRRVAAVANRIFRQVRQREQNVPPLIKLMAGRFRAFRLVPLQIRMATYCRPDSGDYDELFESIESFELNSI